MSRYFPPYRPKRDGRNGGGRKRKRPPPAPKAKPHLFTPSGIVDPWAGPLCSEPCLQPRAASVHRVPETDEAVKHEEARRVGDR